MAKDSALRALAQQYEERAKDPQNTTSIHLLGGARDVALALELAKEILVSAQLPGTAKEPMPPIAIAHAIIMAKLARKTGGDGK